MSMCMCPCVCVCVSVCDQPTQVREAQYEVQELLLSKFADEHDGDLTSVFFFSGYRTRGGGGGGSSECDGGGGSTGPPPCLTIGGGAASSVGPTAESTSARVSDFSLFAAVHDDLKIVNRRRLPNDQLRFDFHFAKKYPRVAVSEGVSEGGRQ
eukprot:GHVU01048004.1.p2 GENE.GHVU01048004.1~~GHVU01048004.1.p2  ORF type:complete len:153 (-),score=28.99 GHVU01048004.1:173-631(-)